MRAERWTAPAVVVAVALCGGVAAFAIDVPEAPFAPEQCGLAAEHARARLAADPGNARAHRIYAEALLCFGAQGDARALHQAVLRLRPIVAAAPDDFFARLYLADALRRRYFLSDEALDTARAARVALHDSDVGVARKRLAWRLDEWIERLEGQRKQFAPLLSEGEATFRNGTATPLEVGDWLLLLAVTGAEAARRAERLLVEYAARSGDPAISSFYRAELLRATLPNEELLRLYERAQDVLCDDETNPARAQRCAAARVRAKRLQEENDGARWSGIEAIEE